MCTNEELGQFEVRGHSSKIHTVSFGKPSEHPECSCKDWLAWHIPCKHFFTIFEHMRGWSWYSLPESFLSNEYMSADTRALSGA